MDQQKTSLKVAKDMFTTQFNWTIGFLGIIFIVNIIKIIMEVYQEEPIEGYFNSIFIATNIYMLIIGIIAINFLFYFVGNGVTRKDNFTGTTLAAVGLSILIPIITIIVFFIEKWILNMFNLSYKVQTINELELDGNIIGDTVQSMILSPYVDPHDNWILAVFVLSLNIFIAYLLGWLIGTAFNRFNLVIGLVSIAIAIIFKMLKDTLLRALLDLPALGWFQALDSLPIGITIVSLLLIIVITFYLIRTMTKRIAIKM